MRADVPTDNKYKKVSIHEEIYINGRPVGKTIITNSQLRRCKHDAYQRPYD
jgi:hypothetical protein